MSSCIHHLMIDNRKWFQTIKLNVFTKVATYCSRSVTTPTLSLNSPVRGSEAQARNIFHDDNVAWMDLNIPNYDIILGF